MIVKSPFTGVGLDNFTVNLDRNTRSTEAVRFMQPAHNVAILWLAETGVMGMLLALMSFVFVKQKLQVTWLKDKLFFIPIIILLPILTLDHYVFSQQTGLLLCIFFLFEFQSETTD
jgi:O-antigen ligase